MLSKNELKYYSSLLIKKFRDEENKFITEGGKIVEEGLTSGLNCEIILITENFLNKEKEFYDKYSKDIRIEILTEKDIRKLCDTVHPQGIASVFQKPDSKLKFEKTNDDLVVCLDNISDPGNLGTIIRNCDWFGITSIILSQNCADIYNPKTIRASMGSVFHINIYDKINLNDLQKLKGKGYQILITDINGENINSFSRNYKSIIVFSNEANGPSNEILSIADKKITIPGKGKAESLNVASASAVILSVLTR